MEDKSPRDRLGSGPWLSVIVISSFCLRLSLFDFQTRDYQYWIKPWCHFFIAHGRWHGLAELTEKITNYPPLYMYFISLSTLMPLPQLYSVKLLSVGVDYLAAWYLWRVLRMGGNTVETALKAVAIFLFLPTVVVNGALWAQCDIMYTTGFVASLYYLLAHRPFPAMVAFGISCCLKPQAIFWVPLLAALLLSGKLTWTWIWVPPAVYLVSCLPAIFAGRPALDLLLHWSQMQHASGLVFNAPNWYQWVGSHSPTQIRALSQTGFVLAGIATCFLILSARRLSRRTSNESGWFVILALASVLFLPFLLPNMHERYFFAADVLSVLYSFYRPYGWCVTALVQFSSAFSYFPFLFHRAPLPLGWLALLVTVAIGWVVWDLSRLWCGRYPREWRRPSV